MSDDNPHNPRTPATRVWWGEQSFDEMGSVIVAVQALSKEDEPALQQALTQRIRAAIGAASRNGTLKRLQEQRAGGR